MGSGPKAYLTWLQKKTRRNLKEFWDRNDRIEYGGIPGRGTSQAISKVLGIRKKCKIAGISTITFLEDAKKAFDTINRRKAVQQWGKILGEKTSCLEGIKKDMKNVWLVQA